MKLNKKLASGIHVATPEFEYIKAVKKPNADTKIIREWWFVGKAKHLKEMLKNNERRL